MSAEREDVAQAETEWEKRADATNAEEGVTNKEIVQEEDHIHLQDQDPVLTQEAEAIREAGEDTEEAHQEITEDIEKAADLWAKAEVDLTAMKEKTEVLKEAEADHIVKVQARAETDHPLPRTERVKVAVTVPSWRTEIGNQHQDQRVREILLRTMKKNNLNQRRL